MGREKVGVRGEQGEGRRQGLKVRREKIYFPK